MEVADESDIEGHVATDVVGRDEEIAALHDFIDGLTTEPATFVLRGGAGIGKTALWEAGVAHARDQGMHVLLARVAEAERGLSFAALCDLLEGIDADVLGRLPDPQRRALEVALLRRDVSGKPPEPRAIAAGLLRTFRELALVRGVLVAIDDMQWLDLASREAVEFAARRLSAERVGFLFTERSGTGSRIPDVYGALRVTPLDVGPLSFGAARHLLVERHGLRFRRHSMRRVFEVTQGNPLFVLEIGRSLAERGTMDIEDDVPLPAAVDDLFSGRLDNLAGPITDAVLCVALDGDLRLPQLASIVDITSIDEAIASGLLVVDGDRLRLFHPLLGRAILHHATARDRRRIHANLADVAADETRRARHLALATARPDEELASHLGAAAVMAGRRGARATAVELAGHALRLTPPRSPAQHERVLILADGLEMAGDFDRVHALLLPLVDELPEGPMRARAHLMLLAGAASEESYAGHLEAAIASSADDPEIHARALAEKAVDIATAKVRPSDEARSLAEEALRVAPTSTDALAAVAWVRILGGRPIDDLVERAAAPGMPAAEIHSSMDRLAGIRAGFRGEVASARATFARLLQVAEERGEVFSVTSIQLQQCEVELRAGDLTAASDFMDEFASARERGIGVVAHLPRVRALIAVQRGLHQEALTWADESWRIGQSWGQSVEQPGWDGLELYRVRGLASLLAGDPHEAVRNFRALWDHCEREGIHDPGAFPVAPDLVEALLAVGEQEEASAVTARLAALTEEQDHPWGRPSVLRCTALLALSDQSGHVDAALMLAEAAAGYGALGLRSERARALLLQGRAERRMRRWRAARVSLADAIRAYEEIDAPGWAAAGRSDLERLGGGGRRAPGALTRSERRVAELAAEGHSNRQIAGMLFVGEHTVEVHLSRVYGKLGIRSRAGLARRLVDDPSAAINHQGDAVAEH